MKYRCRALLGLDLSDERILGSLDRLGFKPVPDGDTMVIGGIIVDNKNDTSNRIPILGDIPILGRLFRRDTEVKDRTSLYFFVTPHIMFDREFADLSTYSYNKKLEAADADPSTCERVKLLPGSSLEFQKPTTEDIVGFVISVVVCFGILGIAFWMATIGS